MPLAQIAESHADARVGIVIEDGGRSAKTNRILRRIAASVGRHGELHLLAKPLAEEQEPRFDLFIELAPIRGEHRNVLPESKRFERSLSLLELLLHGDVPARMDAR